MSWLFWLVLFVGGLASTVAALAISAVILLVIGQVTTLLYQKARRILVPDPAR